MGWTINFQFSHVLCLSKFDFFGSSFFNNRHHTHTPQNLTIINSKNSWNTQVKFYSHFNFILWPFLMINKSYKPNFLKLYEHSIHISESHNIYVGTCRNIFYYVCTLNRRFGNLLCAVLFLYFWILGCWFQDIMMQRKIFLTKEYVMIVWYP